MSSGEVSMRYWMRFAETFRHVETGELTEEVHIYHDKDGRRRVHAETVTVLEVQDFREKTGDE